MMRSVIAMVAATWVVSLWTADAAGDSEMSPAEVGKAMHDAQVHMIKKRYREAEKLLAKVTDSEGPSENRKADAYHMRGHCLSKLGDLDRALVMARKSLEYKDNPARRRMIKIYEDQIAKRGAAKAKLPEVVLDKPVPRPSAKREYALEVEIHADGSLRLGGSKTDLAKITVRAKKAAKKKAEPWLLLRAHREVEVRRIKEVVKAIGAGGITNVTFGKLEASKKP